MKKMLLNLLLIGTVSVAFTMPPVNEQVLKNFTAIFPTVVDARWFESDNHYDVYFEKDETKYHIRYDRSGKVLNTRNFYPGSKLCPFIKAKVTERFAGKSIFGVTEVMNSDEMFYVIVLEDEDSWTNVYADPTGHMKVLEKMKKAK